MKGLVTLTLYSQRPLVGRKWQVAFPVPPANANVLWNSPFMSQIGKLCHLLFSEYRIGGDKRHFLYSYLSQKQNNNKELFFSTKLTFILIIFWPLQALKFVITSTTLVSKIKWIMLLFGIQCNLFLHYVHCLLLFLPYLYYLQLITTGH